MFPYIIDKAWDKTKGWNNHFLSTAGKKILLKSVALAIPVYAMNYFKLPKTICDEINGVLSNFWWGTKNGKRKMAWVSWKRMALSKKQGGLGFGDLNYFNSALLGKQAWRILHSPESLPHRVLKCRYFPDNEFIDATRGTKPSYGWSSILHGRDLLTKVLRWQIGEGNVKAFTEKWIPSHPPRSASSMNLDQNTMVKLKTYGLGSNQMFLDYKKSMKKIDNRYLKSTFPNNHGRIN